MAFTLLAALLNDSGLASISKTDPAAPDQRFAYQVFDGHDDVVFESDDGWTCVIRETMRQQLKAVFFEDGRGMSSLAFQRFMRDGRPLQDRRTLRLSGSEVATLRDFLAKIQVVELHGADCQWPS
jgi:hypothetical protein